MDLKYKIGKYTEKIKGFWSKFRGKPLIFSFLFLSIAFFTYVVVWNLLASFSSKIIGEIDQMRDRGVNISLHGHAMSGFPNNFIVTFEKPIYRNKDKTFGWTTDQFIVTPLSFSERAVRIDFLTDHHFSIRKYGEKDAKRIAIRTENLKLATQFKDIAPEPINLSADSIITQIFSNDLTFHMGKLRGFFNAYNVALSKKWRNFCEHNSILINLIIFYFKMNSNFFS